MKNFYTKGISIVETVIVLAVLAVIFSIIIPQFSLIRERQVLKSAVGDILSSINKAQTQTLASVDSSSYGVYFESGAIVIFKGTGFFDEDASNEVISIVAPANISNVALGAGSPASGSIYFNRLSGSPSTTGTITISTPNYTKTITISATGGASTN
ncbi:GspH/FimT family pseudopilin [Candidatus Nomurabacteria bacterium]|nr:GspH/FimT family pseudopilin [Candidatus Nomurabacteria bacterium]